MTVTFLGHCGFAVDTGSHLLIFDYCPRRLKSQAETLLSGLIRSRESFFFVSHRHLDHYCGDIYDFPAARRFLGEGVPVREGDLSFRGGEGWSDGVLSVEAFPSTDEGVAFLVRVDGLTLYHAGDLNWWYWPGEPDPWNPNMEQAFRLQADRLAEIPIDLAFLDADPRQREGWLYGFDYLMRRGKIRCAVPMHFWNQKSAPGKVLRAGCTAPYRERILASLCACGDRAEVPPETPAQL